MDTDLKNLLTTKQVMELVKERFDGRTITERQITTAVENGHLTPLKVSRVRFFQNKQVEQWLKMLRPSRTQSGRMRMKSPAELGNDQPAG